MGAGDLRRNKSWSQRTNKVTEALQNAALHVKARFVGFGEFFKSRPTLPTTPGTRRGEVKRKKEETLTAFDSFLLSSAFSLRLRKKDLVTQPPLRAPSCLLWQPVSYLNYWRILTSRSGLVSAHAHCSITIIISEESKDHLGVFQILEQTSKRKVSSSQCLSPSQSSIHLVLL